MRAGLIRGAVGVIVALLLAGIIFRPVPGATQELSKISTPPSKVLKVQGLYLAQAESQLAQRGLPTANPAAGPPAMSPAIAEKLDKILDRLQKIEARLRKVEKETNP